MCNNSGIEQCEEKSSEAKIRSSLRGTGYFKRKNKSRDRCNSYGFDFRNYFKAEKHYYKRHVLLGSSISCDSGEDRIVDRVLLDDVEKRLIGRTKEVFQMLRIYSVTHVAEKLGIYRSSVYYHLRKIRRLLDGFNNT